MTLRIIATILLVIMFAFVPFLPTENPWVIPFVMIVFLFLFLSFLRSTFVDSITIQLYENSIEVNRFLGYKRRTYDSEEVLGYSNSEVEIGRSRIKSKSIILYTKDDNAYELIKYNYRNFKQIESGLMKYPNLGYEPYKTGLYFREYRYKNKYNNK